MKNLVKISAAAIFAASLALSTNAAIKLVVTTLKLPIFKVQ